MALATFFRLNFTELWIKLTSNEALGVLDSNYIEDYNGVDGQLTLRNKDTNTTYSLLMSSVPLETPSVDDDVFIGSYPLSSLPNGDYEILGRVRDIAGNYTILTSYYYNLPNTQIVAYDFRIADGIIFNQDLGQSVISGGYSFKTSYAPPNVVRSEYFTSDIKLNSEIPYSYSIRVNFDER